MRTLILAGFLAAALLWAPPASSQVEGSAPFSSAGTSAEAVDRFLADLREAMAQDDRAGVAAMLQYPLQAWDGERSLKVKSAKQLLRNFDRIFDKGLKSTICDATSATAFANYQGVMFEDGRMWLRPTEGEEVLRIVTLNAPAPGN
ncbi:MAG: hypothetical protein ABIV06_06700 [Thermoanaerobaculia bacterium]